jgi:glutaredoxin-related protein
VRWLDPDEDDPRLEDKLFGFADHCNDGCHKYQIVLSKSMCKYASTRFTTLIHEMIHVFLELRDDHGPAFERVRQMLSDRGIFKKGAVIRRLTIF